LEILEISRNFKFLLEILEVSWNSSSWRFLADGLTTKQNLPAVFVYHMKGQYRWRPVFNAAKFG